MAINFRIYFCFASLFKSADTIDDDTIVDSFHHEYLLFALQQTAVWLVHVGDEHHNNSIRSIKVNKAS